MQSYKKILYETFPILLLCTIGGVIAGVVLQGMCHDFEKIPGLLILVPAILGMRGNISGALGSRLGSALHLGLIKPKIEWNPIVKTNIYAAITLNILMSFLLGIISHVVALIFNLPTPGIVLLTLISLIAGTLAGIIMPLLTYGLAVLAYSVGFDPDNVLAPSLATIGDILTILCLFLAAKIVHFL